MLPLGLRGAFFNWKLKVGFGKNSYKRLLWLGNVKTANVSNVRFDLKWVKDYQGKQ